MTHEQRQWLLEHPPYEPVGRAAGGVVFIGVEHLLPNGSLASAPTNTPLIAVEQIWEGAPFEPITVGIKTRVAR